MELSILDWISFITIAMALFYWLWFYSKRKMKEDPKYAYLPYGFLIKILGGSFFALIFFYVYEVGDTFLYWSGAVELSHYFWKDPQTYFQALTTGSEGIQDFLPGIFHEIPYARTEEEWFMVRILSFLNIICFDNYLLLLLFTTGFSFAGSWLIFEVLDSHFKGYRKIAFISSFLIPTVIIWSGGIIKDSLVFGLIGLLVYAFYLLFFNRKQTNLLLWIAFVFAIYIIFKLKSYIIICLLPALLLGLYVKLKSQITSYFIRIISGPILFSMMLVSMFFLVQSLSEISEKYEIEKLEKKAEGFHTWHVTTGGATYNLGKIDYTAVGVSKKIPEALNVTFFRPYFWEIKNAGMAIAALESFTILILFCYFIFYRGIKSMRFILKEPLLIAFVTFAIILGFAAGFTSYNFGALVRYKMPLMPFLVFTLLYMGKLKWTKQLK